jgi:hypothetical protein
VTNATTIGAIKRTIVDGKLFGAALIDPKVHLLLISPHARTHCAHCTHFTHATHATHHAYHRKAPPPIDLLYTPSLLAAGTFGNALDDESTLGQHSVLHDDLLYLRLPAPEPPPPPPKKKK